MSKVDQITGVVTVSIAGITAALTPSDLMEFGTVILSLAPLLLILFLIWRVRELDRQLESCRKEHSKVSEKLLLAFVALNDPKVRDNLPPAEDIISGKFSVKDCLGDRCDLD